MDAQSEILRAHAQPATDPRDSPSMEELEAWNRHWDKLDAQLAQPTTNETRG